MPRRRGDGQAQGRARARHPRRLGKGRRERPRHRPWPAGQVALHPRDSLCGQRPPDAAKGKETHGPANRTLRGVGPPRRTRPAHRQALRPAALRPERGEEPLGVPAGEGAEGASSSRFKVQGSKSHRRLRCRQVGREEMASIAACRQTHAQPPRLLRSARPAAFNGRGRGVRRGQVTRCLREARGQTPRLAALWRALGPSLA